MTPTHSAFSCSPNLLCCHSVIQVSSGAWAQGRWSPDSAILWQGEERKRDRRIYLLLQFETWDQWGCRPGGRRPVPMRGEARPWGRWDAGLLGS